jgi:CubicO group peptidase (beta-lactamase class C family)
MHRLILVLALTWLSLWNSRPLRAENRLDPAALARLLDAAKESGTAGIAVWKDGAPAGEWYFSKTKAADKIDIMSATKAVVSLGIGKLVTDGLLQGPDQPVSSLFPEWKSGPKNAITIRHLLQHSSGLHDVTPATVEIYPSRDFVKLALDSALDFPPGTRYQYNNKATNLLAGVIAKASGKPMDEYIRESIFKPLGVQDIEWLRDRAGNPHGMSGLKITAADFARLGQLVLQRGFWNGTQIIASSWFEESMKPSPLRPTMGFLWWLVSEEMWIAIGEPEVEKVRKTGVSNELSSLLPSLIGEYRDNGALRAKADSAIGAADTPLRRELAEAIKKLPDGTWYRLEAKGAVRVWEARGSFGNTLTVIPQQNLVIARICRPSKDAGSKDIRDFEKLVQELTPPKTAGQTYGTQRNRTVENQ